MTHSSPKYRFVIEIVIEIPGLKMIAHLLMVRDLAQVLVLVLLGVLLHLGLMVLDPDPSRILLPLVPMGLVCLSVYSYTWGLWSRTGPIDSTPTPGAYGPGPGPDR